MKRKVLLSCGTKEDLQKMINEYYYSTNYIITDDNRAYNTKLDKYLDNIIEFKRNRWYFYHA